MRPPSSIRRLLYRIRPADLTFLVCKLLKIQREVVDDKDGNHFWVHPISHFGNELLETKGYEKTLSEVVKALLRPGDTFVDIGANEGYFSVLAANIIKNGVIHSVEPQSRLQEVIQKNLSLNQVSSANLHQLAFASEEGTETLYLTSTINSGGSSFFRRNRRSESEEVRTTTLDTFFQKNALSHVRLVKVDCEGAELTILKGATEVLSKQKVEFWSIDFHPGLVGNEVPFEIDGMLRKAGYVLTQVANGGWLYHLPALADSLSPLGPTKRIEKIS